MQGSDQAAGRDWVLDEREAPSSVGAARQEPEAGRADVDHVSAVKSKRMQASRVLELPCGIRHDFRWFHVSESRAAGRKRNECLCSFIPGTTCRQERRRAGIRPALRWSGKWGRGSLIASRAGGVSSPGFIAARRVYRALPRLRIRLAARCCSSTANFSPRVPGAGAAPMWTPIALRS